MSEWKETIIGNVSEVKTGPFGSALLNKQYIKGGTPVITVEHIKDFRICQLDYPSVTDDDKRRLGSYTLEEGDIVFSRVGSVDLSAIALRENDGWLFSSRMLRVRPNRKKIDPLFLSYYLRLYGVRKYINNIAVGSTMPSINTEILKSIPIIHCELEEQKEIAKTLSNLDQKITLLRQQNHDLEDLAQTLFKRWFVEFEFPNENGEPYKSSGGKMVGSELGEIPEGWRLKTLDEIVKVHNGYSYKGVELKESDVALVTLKNFDRKGGFRFDGFKELVSNSYKHKHVVSTGDLIVAHTDLTQDAAVLGNPAIIMKNGKYRELVISMDLVKIESLIENIKIEFLYYLMKDKRFKYHCKGYANGTTVLHLSKSAIPEYVFPYPTKNKLFEDFGNYAESVYKIIIFNIEEIQTLTQLRDTLLPKLMSGELRVNS